MQFGVRGCRTYGGVFNVGPGSSWTLGILLALFEFSHLIGALHFVSSREASTWRIINNILMEVLAARVMRFLFLGIPDQEPAYRLAH